jgi:hypothetical protein
MLEAWLMQRSAAKAASFSPEKSTKIRGFFDLQRNPQRPWP